MLTTVRKTFTWSRIALIFFAFGYTLLSAALIPVSFVASTKTFGFVGNEKCKDLSCAFFSWAYFFALGLVACVVAITSGLITLNIIRVPERKRLISGGDGVGAEKLSLYVMRATLFTLVLYGVAVYIGWNAPGTNMTPFGVPRIPTASRARTAVANGIFIKDITGQGWAATRVAMGLLHLASLAGILLTGFAAGLARPVPSSSSLKPASPGTIASDLPSMSRVSADALA
ncbi:hypothetical protein LIA77_10218 [Sarocladium implicatum]|nr:hypothetical protein LIA77_10218 [Sarocladium implicatum]